MQARACRGFHTSSPRLRKWSALCRLPCPALQRLQLQACRLHVAGPLEVRQVPRDQECSFVLRRLRRLDWLHWCAVGGTWLTRAEGARSTQTTRAPRPAQRATSRNGTRAGARAGLGLRPRAAGNPAIQERPYNLGRSRDSATGWRSSMTNGARCCSAHGRRLAAAIDTSRAACRPYGRHGHCERCECRHQRHHSRARG